MRLGSRALLPLVVAAAALIGLSGFRAAHLQALHQTAVWSSAATAADDLWSTAQDAVSAAVATFSADSAAAADTSALESAVVGFRASTANLPLKPLNTVPQLPPLAPSFDEPCFVSRWDAIWLVYPNRTRNFVRQPPAGCIQRSTPVDEELVRLPKTHHGDGAYFLSEEESIRACRRFRGCPIAAQLPPIAAAASAAQLPPIAAAASTGAQTRGAGAQAPSRFVTTAAATPPANSAAHGSAPGAGAWMERTALTFNGAARRRFGQLRMQIGEPLMVVFGGASVNDMLINWANHVQRLALEFVVACMDEKLFELAENSSLPAVMLNQLAGQAQRINTRWKYYRMDPKAFLNMGLYKVRFFVEFLKAGFDVLCSDLDVVWLSDPRPWVMGAVESSALLEFSDVVVSVDATSDITESDKQGWGVHGEMNTGMILLRSTRGSLVLCHAWIERMEQEVQKVSKLSSNFVQWWTNDQTFFNEVVHRSRTLKPEPKSWGVHERAEAHAMLSTSAAGRRAGVLSSLINRISEAHAVRNESYLSKLRGITLKSMPCSGVECPSGVLPVAISTFPYTHFASGHTYFTQSLQMRLGFTPVAVHTTFQFGDTPEFTWGKRNRLRERMLWSVDDDSYYARTGPGTHPEEVKYRGYVQLTGTLVEEAMLQVLRTESDSSIKIEGHQSYSDGMRTNVKSIGELAVGNPNRHLLLDAFQRRLVINLVALGRALRRKVIMPKMMCWCDRYWWLLENCRFPSVKAAVHPMPFHCPFDHLYDLEKWVHSDVPMREYSFLQNPRLPVGASYATVRAELDKRGWQEAFVVQVHARSLELLCEDLGSRDENRKFNSIMHTVLGVAEQIRYCDRAANPWFNVNHGPYDQMRNPINCTWGFHRPPPLPEVESTCESDTEAILQKRRLPPRRAWTEQGKYGIFARYDGQQIWSINERVADLYRQYI